MPYIIREVDSTDEDVVEQLDFLNKVCFWRAAPAIDHSLTHRWWFAYDWTPHFPAKKEILPIAFGGFCPSRQYRQTGYLYRSGVLKAHRGHGLQGRLIRVRERAARRMGWSRLVTDTSGNQHSANNLIAAGYHVFTPKFFWSFPEAIYWTKEL